MGGFSFYAARMGLIRDIDGENPMEALLFGALISAVDPVATLSIMGNAELKCDPLLYSLVFGESVLNDAIAISLFKVFAKYYDPSGPDWSESEIPKALWQFLTVSLLSIGIGVGLGLGASFLYKHTDLSEYPKLETSLLFSFCYLCYATGEALGLSGIMALFFQGVVLSQYVLCSSLGSSNPYPCSFHIITHIFTLVSSYNSYNLSATAHVASEHIFSTLATIAETAVFLYMGMGVFTGRFENWDIVFSVLALVFCGIGRLVNIFPLSWMANLCRTSRNHISLQMQTVLWFAGLRGAIAFALSMNMPGPNKEIYATATLSICIFTTVVCGGFTDSMLSAFGMKDEMRPGTLGDGGDDEGNQLTLNRVAFSPSTGRRPRFQAARNAGRNAVHGIKKLWSQFDDDVLKVYFGGEQSGRYNRRHGRNGEDDRGNYELTTRHAYADEPDGNGSIVTEDEESDSDKQDDERGRFIN